jgi:hypothetical protein
VIINSGIILSGQKTRRMVLVSLLVLKPAVTELLEAAQGLQRFYSSREKLRRLGVNTATCIQHTPICPNERAICGDCI